MVNISRSRSNRIVGSLIQQNKYGSYVIELKINEPQSTGVAGLARKTLRERIERIAKAFVGIEDAICDAGYILYEIKESAYARQQHENRKKNMIDKLLEERGEE